MGWGGVRSRRVRMSLPRLNTSQSLNELVAMGGGGGGGGAISRYDFDAVANYSIQFNSKNFNYPTRGLIILTFV